MIGKTRKLILYKVYDTYNRENIYLYYRHEILEKTFIDKIWGPIFRKVVEHN